MGNPTFADPLLCVFFLAPPSSLNRKSAATKKLPELSLSQLPGVPQNNWVIQRYLTWHCVVGTQKTFVEPTCCLFSFLLPCGRLLLYPAWLCLVGPWHIARFHSVCCLIHSFSDLINVALTEFQLRSNRPGLGVCPALPLSKFCPFLSPVLWPPA